MLFEAFEAFLIVEEDQASSLHCKMSSSLHCKMSLSAISGMSDCGLAGGPHGGPGGPGKFNKKKKSANLIPNKLQAIHSLQFYSFSSSVSFITPEDQEDRLAVSVVSAASAITAGLICWKSGIAYIVNCELFYMGYAKGEMRQWRFSLGVSARTIDSGGTPAVVAGEDLNIPPTIQTGSEISLAPGSQGCPVTGGAATAAAGVVASRRRRAAPAAKGGGCTTSNRAAQIVDIAQMRRRLRRAVGRRQRSESLVSRSMVALGGKVSSIPRRGDGRTNGLPWFQCGSKSVFSIKSSFVTQGCVLNHWIKTLWLLGNLWTARTSYRAMR